MDINETQGLNDKLSQAQAQANFAQGQGDALQQQAFPGLIQPIDLIINNGMAVPIETKENKEISLQNLSKEEIAKIMDSYQKCKNEADSYYNDTIEPTIMSRQNAYLATEEYYKERFPKLSRKSKFCSRDIKTTIDTLIPSFAEVFCGSDEPVDVRGVNVEDDDRASKMQQLLKYQLQRKNNYTSFIEYIIRDALMLNYAVAKVYWNRKEKRERYQMMIRSQDTDILIMLRTEEQNGKIKVISAEPLKDAPDLIVLVFEKIIVTANYPVLAYMPPSELRFTPDAPDLQGCKFKAHRKVVSGDYLKRKEREGIYQNIDKALSSKGLGDTTSTEFDIDKSPGNADVSERLSDNDKASKRVELYEAYMSVDYNNDGIYEEIIVHAVGNTPIRIARNDNEMAPFFVCEAESSPHTVFNENEAMTDNLIQQQDLKTAIFRQLIINVAQNNSPQTYINENMVDMDAVIAGKSIIPVITGPGENMKDAVWIPPALPFNPMAQTILEYSQNEIESQSGSTRYNQGLDSNSLNKTATGVTAILGQSEKRMKNTARLMSENFLVPLMKYVILLDQKFLKDNEVIRLTNSNVSISKQDLDIDYDLIINVGQGAGTREAQIQYMMILIRELLPALEARGITDAKTWYENAKDLLEKMGIRAAVSSLVDPESDKGQAIAQQQAEIAQQTAQHDIELAKVKGEIELAKARTPNVSVQYRDLPLDAKEDMLEANGIGSTVGNIARQEMINHA